MGWGLADIATDGGPPPAPAAATAPPASQFQTQAPRAVDPSEGGDPGTVTNLSPSDYAKLQTDLATQAPSPDAAPVPAVQATPVPAAKDKPADKPAWTMQDLQQNTADPVVPAAPVTPAPPVAAAPATQPATPDAPTGPVTVPLSTANPYDLAQSVVHGASLGADEFIAPAAMASVDWIGHKLTGDPESWGQSYDAERNQMVSDRQNYDAQHPVSSSLATMGGGFLTPVAPLFSSAPAATMLGKGVNLVRNIGASAALGGASGFGMTDGTMQDRIQGAENGAVLGGALGAGIQGLSGLVHGAAPAWNSAAQIISPGARDTAIGAQLNQMTNGAAMEAPVLPGVSYNIGQASNAPEAAAAARWAREQPAGGAIGTAQDTANNQAVRGALEQASGNPAGPASVADSSTGLVGAIRDASDIAADHSRQLWSTGPLATRQIPTAPFANELKAANDGLDVGLQLGRTGPVQQVLDMAKSLPPTATARDLNSFKSALQRVARNPPEGNPQAAATAARLADAARTGIDAAIATHGDQALQAQYTAAKAFTAKAKGVFGTQDARALLSKNPNGQFKIDPSEGGKKFFNFANGSPEGANNLREISDFLKSFRGDWTKLHAGGLSNLNPSRIDAAQTALMQHGREFVVGSLLKASGLSRLDTNGEHMVNLNSTLKFLDTNRKWMQSSGMFSHQQIDLFDRVSKTAAALKRTQDLRAAGNSTTYESFHGDKFLDKIISPWIGRLTKLAAAGVGYHVNGFEGVFEGGFAGHMVDKVFDGARESLREVMMKAALDPKLAANLMAKATPQNVNYLGKAARGLLSGSQVAVGQMAATLPKVMNQVELPNGSDKKSQ